MLDCIPLDLASVDSTKIVFMVENKILEKEMAVHSSILD